MARRHASRLVAISAVAAVAALTALTVSATRPSDAAYPGANGRIAYAYGKSYGYGGGQIWSANSDGSSPTTLTSGSNDSSPAYSPNGSRIAFERQNGVVVMNADGSAAAQLLSGNYSFSSKTDWESEYENPESPSEKIPFVKITTYTETWHGFNSPSFSPDGSQLAVGETQGEFVTTIVCEVKEDEDPHCLFGYEGGYFHYEEECINCGAHIVNVSSSTGAIVGDVTPFAKGTADYEPSYSPNGKIAFSRWIGPSGYSIFVVNSPGAAPSRVTNGPEDYAPDFSPDGSRIAFSHRGEIALVGVGGGPLTLLPIPLPPDAWGGYSESPAFSPDGSKIASEHTVYPEIGKTERGIYTMGVDGSGPTKVIDGGSAPSWQPLPIPTPPKAKPKKGKVKLNKKGRAKIGSIVCGSSACRLKVLSARLKAGKKRCSAMARVAKRLGAGKKAKVDVKVAGKCLAALKKAGKGRLTVKFKVIDAAGKHMLTLKVILVPYEGKAGKAHKGKGGR